MNYMNLIRGGGNYGRYQDDEENRYVKQLIENSYNKDTGFGASVSSMGINPYQWTLSHQNDYEPTVPKMDTNAFLSRLYGNRNEKSFYDTVTKPRYQYAPTESKVPNIPIDSDFYTNKDIYNAENMLKYNNVKLPDKKSDKEDKPSLVRRILNKISPLSDAFSNIKYNMIDGDSNTGIKEALLDTKEAVWNNNQDKLHTGYDIVELQKKKMKEKGLDELDIHTLPVRWALKGTRMLNNMIYKNDKEQLKKSEQSVDKISNFVGGLFEDIVMNPFTYLDIPVKALTIGSKATHANRAISSSKELKGFSSALEELTPMFKQMDGTFDAAKEAKQMVDRVNTFNKVTKEGEGGLRWFGKTFIDEQTVAKFADKLPHTKMLNAMGEGYKTVSNNSKTLTGINDLAKNINKGFRKKFVKNAEFKDLIKNEPDTAAKYLLLNDFTKQSKNYKTYMTGEYVDKTKKMIDLAKKNGINLEDVADKIEKIPNPVEKIIDKNEYNNIYKKTKEELELKLEQKTNDLDVLKRTKDIKNPSYTNLEKEITNLNLALGKIEKYKDFKVAEDLSVEPLKAIKEQSKKHSESYELLKSLAQPKDEAEAAFTTQMNLFDKLEKPKSDVIKPLIEDKEIKNIKDGIKPNISIDEKGQLNFLDNIPKNEGEQLGFDDILKKTRNQGILEKSNNTIGLTSVDKQMADTLYDVMSKRATTPLKLDVDTGKIVEDRVMGNFPKNYSRELFYKDLETVKDAMQKNSGSFSIEKLIGYDALNPGKFNPHAMENIRNLSFELRNPVISKWKNFIHDNLTGRSIGLKDVFRELPDVGEYGSKQVSKIDGVMSDVRKDMWKIQKEAKANKLNQETLESILKDYSMSKIREVEKAFGDTPEKLEELYNYGSKITAKADKDKAIIGAAKQRLDTAYERDIKAEVANFFNQNKGSETWRNVLKDSEKGHTNGKGNVVLDKIANNGEVTKELTPKAQKVIDFVNNKYGVDLTDSMGKTIYKEWQLDNIMKYFTNRDKMGERTQKYTESILKDAVDTGVAVEQIYDIIKDAPDKIKDKGKIVNNIGGHNFIGNNKETSYENIMSKINQKIEQSKNISKIEGTDVSNVINLNKFKEDKARQIHMEELPRVIKKEHTYDNPVARMMDDIVNNNDRVTDLGKRESNRINKLLNNLGVDTGKINHETLGVTKDNISNFESVLEKATTETPKPIGKTATNNINELLRKTGLDNHYKVENMDINRKNYGQWKKTLNEIAENKEQIVKVDTNGKYMPKLAKGVEDLDNPNAFLDTIKRDNKEAYNAIMRAKNDSKMPSNVIMTPKNTQEIVEARLNNKREYLDKIDKLINSPQTKNEIQKTAKQITGIEDSIKDFDNYFREMTKSEPNLLKAQEVYKKLTIDEKLEHIPSEYREIAKMFMEDMEKFGKEEVEAGILSNEQFERTVNKYVPHQIHSEFKENYNNISESSKNILSGILENNTPGFAKGRKYHDTIKGFNDYVEKLTGGEVKHFFETNLARTYLQRAYQHSQAIYDRNVTEATLKLFGTELEHFSNGEKIGLGLKNLASALTKQQHSDISHLFRTNPLTTSEKNDFNKELAKRYPNMKRSEAMSMLTSVTDHKEIQKIAEKIMNNDYVDNFDKVASRHIYYKHFYETEPKYSGIFKPNESLSVQELSNIRKEYKNIVDGKFDFSNNKEAKESVNKILSGKYNDKADEVITNLKMKKYIELQEQNAITKHKNIKNSIKEEQRVGMLKVDTYKQLKEMVDKNASAYESIPRMAQKGITDMPEILVSHDTEMLRKVKNGDYVLVYPEGEENIKRIQKITDTGLAEGFAKDTAKNAEQGIRYSGLVKVNPNDVNLETVIDKNVKVFALPKEVYGMVDTMAKEQFVQDQNAFVNILDKFQTLWKQNALLSVGFHTRNATGNTFQNFCDLGVKCLSPEVNHKALKILTAKNGDEVVQIGKKSYTINEFKKLASIHGAIDVETDFQKGAKAFKKGVTNDIVNGTKLINKLNPLDTNNFALYNASNKLGGVIENQARLVNFITHLEEGKTANVAAELTNKFLFDYSDLTPFEKKFMKRIYPFYTWLRKNIPLQMEMLMNNQTPIKLAEKFRRTVNKPMDEKDKKYAPEFANGWINLGKTKEGKYRFLDMSLPYQDLEKLTDVRDMASGLSPLIKVPLEQFANKDLYFDTPIQSRKGQLVKSPMVAKPFYKMLGGDKDINGEKYIPTRTAHVIKNISPSLNTVERMTKKVEKDTNMGIKAIMGAKYYDFDVDMAKRKEKSEYLDELYDIIKNEKQLGRYAKEEKPKKEKEKKAVTQKEKDKYLQLLYKKSKSKR